MNSERTETSEFKLYGQMLWRRRYAFLAVFALILGVTAIHSVTQPKIYQSSILLLISSRERTPKVVRDDRNDANQQQEVDQSQELATEVQVLGTLPLISTAVGTLQSRYPEMTAEIVAEKLKIKQVEKSGLISIEYRDTNPERLQQVLVALGETYVDFSLKRGKSGVTSAIEFIKETLPDAKRTLEFHSQELERLRKNNSLVDPSVLGSTVVQSLADIDGQQRNVSVTLSQSQALYQHLRGQLGLQSQQALAKVSLSQDPIYLDLLKQYQEAENKYSLGQRRYQAISPPLQRLQANRDQYKQLLQNRLSQIVAQNLSSVDGNRYNDLQIAQVGKLLEVENNLKVQQAQLAALQFNRQILESKFQLVPDLQRRYDNLVRQVGVSAKSLDNLLTKLEELRIIEAQESPSWQVVQPPGKIAKPVSPNMKINFAIGFILALIGGFGVVYLQEQLDNRLKNVNSVRDLIPVPLLGIVPQAEQLILQLNTFTSAEYFSLSVNASGLREQVSYFREAFRSILFNLRYADADEIIKAVGFTSSICGEGKSTIVRHLGISAAELGQRVLIIDADLRQPKLHEALHVSNEQGLSNVLATDISWQEVVQETAQTGLQVITAGAIPPNPVALLDSIKMSQLMHHLRQDYDLVLIDLPPVIGLTDSLVVATYLDGLVLLVGLNQVTRDHLKVSLESLSRTRSRLIGAIANMAQVSELPISEYIRKNKNQTLGQMSHRFVQDIRSRFQRNA